MKLKINDLIRKKELLSPKFKEVEVASLGGSLEIKKMPLSAFLELIDDLDDKTKTAEAIAKQVEVIYECCPILHSKELQEAFECVEPTDIVYKILDDNLAEIARIFNEILAFFGMDDDELKNL